MNTAVSPETRALATVADTPYELAIPTDAASMILGPSFDRIQAFAGLMAKGAVSVPKHLRGNMGDCMAITIQALGWKMNPFAVAQKTHLSQSGALGYEAQLISAVLVSSGAITAEPDFEPVGDWSQVLGKVEERTGKARDDGSPGGKYYVATYTKKDEEGLGVIVRATLRGQSKPRELKVMMTQAFPRFSTQWATDPYQQLCYLAVRKWGRLHSPGSILGVYTDEELEHRPARDMGMADVVVPPAEKVAPVEPETWPDGAFAKQLPKFLKAIADGKTVDDIIAWAETKGALTDKQKAAIREGKPAAKPEAPAVTYAQVAAAMNSAKDIDALNTAADLIGEVADPGQRTELAAIFDARNAQLQGA